MDNKEYLHIADQYIYEDDGLVAKAKAKKGEIDSQIKKIQKATDELYKKVLKGDKMSLEVLDTGLKMLNKIATEKSDSKEVKAFLKAFVK